MRLRNYTLTALACLPTLAASEVTAPDSRVIAVVNGVEITTDQRPGLTGPEVAADYDSLSSGQKDQLLIAMINRQLLLEEAHKEGFDQQPRVQAAMKAIAETYLVEQFVLEVSKGFDFGEEAVEAWYREHYSELPEQFLVSHILLTSEDEARAVLEDLAGGAGFGDLARNRSRDATSAKQGGQIGWLNVKEMAPDFAEAVVALKEGATAKQPVRTHSGWHVVRLDDRRDAEAPPLDSVRGEIIKALMARQMGDYLEDLRQRAAIEIR